MSPLDPTSNPWEKLQAWFLDTDGLSCGAVVEALNQKTKPPGSLGQLEQVAAQLALCQQTLKPVVDPARIIVFAGDHGIAAEGVSAFPSTVTQQMMANFSNGGAAVCVLSAVAGVAIEVVDVGVDADLSALPGVVQARVASGTRNFMLEPAMSKAECAAAMQVGEQAIARAVADGVQCVGFGEMGIANTTAASAMLGLMLDLHAAQVTGKGTGVEGQALIRKQAVVAAALTKYRSISDCPLSILQHVGGLEIAAIAGASVAAHKAGLIILVDGFISTVAVSLALRLAPQIRRSLFFSHQSAENAHARALAACDGQPLLSLGMRLGEGSACALALPLLRGAAAMLSDMSTFETAGVSGSSNEEP